MRPAMPAHAGRDRSGDCLCDACRERVAAAARRSALGGRAAPRSPNETREE
jgi:hypothetical protein